MLGFPYDLRVRLGEEVPAQGQIAVMRRIPMFDGPEVYNITEQPQERKDSFKCAVFNMEHGCRNREIVPFLLENRDLCDADILFGNELDDGTERSGNFDSSKAIAEALGYNYAYALEFVELVNPNDMKGYEGNTLFSKWPIIWAKSLYVPEEYNWYFDEQVRIGGRVAVYAEIDINGKHVGAVCIHLENRTTPEGRGRQTEAILQKADEWFGNIPIVVGGDYNTNTFDGRRNDLAQIYLDEQVETGRKRDPEQYEPTFEIVEREGYHYRDFNGKYLETRRKPMGDTFVGMHLDWIFAKNTECLGHGMVSTVLAECDWLPADSVVRQYTGKQLSDHNAVWAVCKL